MASTELAFETLLLALESTRGTAISAPTHLLNMGGLIAPKNTTRWAKERRGTLAGRYRHVITKKWEEWNTNEEAADPNLLPVLLNMAMAAVTSPTTPSSGVLTRDWTFTRNITSDTIKAATLWFGDPNIMVYRGAYGMLDELVLSSDASADDGVLMVSAKGMVGPTAEVADPTVPASIAGVLLPSQLMRLYIDTSSTIGTTEITGRLLSATHTISTGVTYKNLGGGPTASLGYSSTGRTQEGGIVTKLRFEVPDTTQRQQWEAGTDLKVRVEHHGAVIETVSGPLTYYNGVFVDTYGPFEVIDLGENANSNRTYEMTINGMVDSTLASDCRVLVRSQRTTL